jgi:hypothetical protein
MAGRLQAPGRQTVFAHRAGRTAAQQDHVGIAQK